MMPYFFCKNFKKISIFYLTAKYIFNIMYLDLLAMANIKFGGIYGLNAS